MTKSTLHKSVSTAKVDSVTSIWLVIAAGFGALLVVSFLAPVDSVSISIGMALPQNLGWLLLAALAALASRHSRVQARVSRFELVVVCGGLCWLIAVTLLTSGHGNGRAVWNGFWQVMSLASCFYIGRALLHFRQVRATVIHLLLVGCTAMSFVGLEQVLVSLPANRAKYAADPESVLAEYGFDAPPGSPRRAQFEDRLNSPEPFANFALANSLASLLCLGVFLTGGWLTNSIQLDTATQKEKVLRWGSLAGLSIALLTQLNCLLLTRSRTAYLSMLLALGFWLILEWMRGKVRLTGRTMRRLGVAVGAFVLVGFAWLLTVDSLVLTEASKSISYRLEYWRATLAMIREHAWTGVGLGNFQAYYPQYKLEQASEIIADPHNWVLDVAATLSVPIALLAVVWVGVTVSKGMGACLVDDTAACNENENEIESQRGRQLARGVALGAVVGGGFSAALLALTGNLDLATNLFAWGFSAALGGLAWRGGACHASSSHWVAAVVAVVLSLLSSGSWQASGIAVPLLVLLAIHWQWSLRLQSQEPPEPVGPEPVGQVGAFSWVAPLVATSALTIFVIQTWRPVMQSWMLAENAAAARSVAERLRLFELAAAADPLDVDRTVQKLQLLAAKTKEAPDSVAFTAEAAQVMVELKRISEPNVVGYLIPKMAGEISMQLAAGAAVRALPNQEYLTAAGGFYSQAVERYPSSVEQLIQLAAAAALAGDWRAAAQSVEKATEISKRTPHLDKKLAAQVILLPLKPTGFEAQSDYVPAEPLADWLRTESKAKLR